MKKIDEREAREYWENKTSMGEALKMEDIDYILERVSDGKFDGLQAVLKRMQDAAFKAWLERTKQENLERSVA